MLMYSPLQGSITSIDTIAVSGGNDIGSKRIVTVKDEKIEEGTAAKGNKACRTLYGLNIQTGTKSEMQQLDDNFVAGSWITSFLQNEKPKSRK